MVWLRLVRVGAGRGLRLAELGWTAGKGWRQERSDEPVELWSYTTGTPKENNRNEREKLAEVC